MTGISNIATFKMNVHSGRTIRRTGLTAIVICLFSSLLMMPTWQLGWIRPTPAATQGT
jgi:hypothetical protein